MAKGALKGPTFGKGAIASAVRQGIGGLGREKKGREAVEKKPRNPVKALPPRLKV